MGTVNSRDKHGVIKEIQRLLAIYKIFENS